MRDVGVGGEGWLRRQAVYLTAAAFCVGVWAAVVWAVLWIARRVL